MFGFIICALSSIGRFGVYDVEEVVFVTWHMVCVCSSVRVFCVWIIVAGVWSGFEEGNCA